MGPEDFPLSPEALRRFVPFDELTPEARTRLIPQAEILRIPRSQEISEVVHDSRYTFYLLDGELALMAGERLVDTLRGGSPICRFPLSRLRSGQLATTTNTTVRLLRVPRGLVSQQLNTDAPPRTAPEPHSSATGTASVSPAGVLAAMEAVTSPLSANNGEQEQLGLELAGAEAEIESALQDKAEATIARRLWAGGFYGLETSAEQAELPSLETQMVELLSNQARLEERSRNASEALTKAQRHKLDVEAALRSVEKNYAQELAKAGATCEQLHHKAQAGEVESRDEEQQLQDQYQRISIKLAQLEETRQDAEQRIEAERKQLQERFATTRSQLQKEADDIQAALHAAREKAVSSADAISSALARERVRAEVEMRLRQARLQLESELEQSELALRAAQQELDAAQFNRQATEHEAQELAAQLQANITNAEDDSLAPPSPSDTSASKVCLWSGKPGLSHQEFQETLPSSLDSNGQADGQKLADHFTKGGPSRSPEQELRAELEAIRHKLARADRRITEAADAKDQAAQTKCKVEEQVALHRAVEDELRLEISEETEKRLQAEWQRSDDEASASVALVEAMGSRTFAPSGGSPVDINEGMLGDIQQQLQQSAAPTHITQAMQPKTDAERRAVIARAAQENARAERLKAKRDLQRAREHLIELRTRMRETRSTGLD